MSVARLSADDAAEGAAAGSPASRALRALTLFGDSDLQEIVNLVRSICEVRYVGVAILDGDLFHLRVTTGLDPFVCGSEESLCVHTMDTPDTVVVPDAREDERFRGSPYVDGRRLAVRFYASAPLYGPDDLMVGRLCVLHDEPHTLDDLQVQTISTLAANASQVIQLRIRQAEDEQHRAEHLAASEEVLRVAAQISHDLRVPLTALTTSLEMLHEAEPEGIDPIRRRVFGSARRSAQRMALMVEGILRLNDVDRSLTFRDTDLEQVARQVITDSDPMLEQAGASVTIGSLPTVYADGDQMYSLLLNLVSNAIKFVRPGVSPVIDLSAVRTRDGWRISVTDNGAGIPADKRLEVFSMFSRLNSSVEGHGIGLATVARIVQVHGGRVGVQDAPVHGTEIWFELPDHHETSMEM